MAPMPWTKPGTGYSTLEYYDLSERLPEVAPNHHAKYAEQLGSGNLQVTDEAKGSDLPQVVSTAEHMYAVPLESGALPGYPYDGKGALHLDPDPNRRSADTLICGMRRRIFWVLVTAAALLILVAALGGALGATVGKGSSNAASGGQISSPLATTTMTTSGTATTSSGASATTTGYTGLRTDSHLAAIAFDDGQGGQQYAVYYQDEKNSIKQSLWNSSLQTWNVSYVWTASDVLSGGAFSASVNFVPSTYQIELYYVATDQTLKELYLIPGATKWSQGFATAQNYGTYEDSGLVLADNLCPDFCNNDLLWFWQDANKAIRVGNSSVAVGLNDSVIIQDALEGTPISATPFANGDGPLNYALFYYDGDSQLQVSLWSPTRVKNLSNSTGEGWSSPTSLGSGSARGSLTAFSSASSDTSPSVTVINSADSGLQVTTIAINEQGEVVSTNAQSSTIIDSWTNSTSIAINAQNQLFGIVNGTIQQYSMQSSNQDWSLIGTVPTK